MNHNIYQQRMPQNQYSQNKYSQQKYSQHQYSQQKSNQSSLPFKIGAPNQYILYYSNYCINCKEFINILCKNSIYSNFKKINVSVNRNYPSIIKSVPTIIVPNIERPLIGEEVFQWLEHFSSKRTKTMQEEIIPYSPGEMGSGLTDSYSYLDSKDTEQPMEHTFSFIK